MKKLLYTLSFLVLLVSCTSQKNTEEFIKNTEGRYLFNANEVLEIYFKDQILHAKWRGNDDIEILKVNDSAFYMKELNEKVLFVNKPSMHIELAPKTEHKGVIYNFKKLDKGEKTPSEYFLAKEFDKALIAFKKIQEKDSLNPAIRQRNINSLGYDFIRKNKVDSAIEIFKINVALYPKTSNVYDSLGEAYFETKNHTEALKSYYKVLSLKPDDKNAVSMVEKINQTIK